MTILDPITALAFSIFENKGVYALLLGSGLSSAAQIPTGWKITLDLVRRAGPKIKLTGSPGIEISSKKSQNTPTC
jgi:hypothetical protein